MSRMRRSVNILRLRFRGTWSGVLSEIAFHEKAGRSQVDSCRASLNKVFFSRRVATVAMLPFALLRAIGFARCTLGVLVSAGAAICLAPCGSALAEWNLGQAINAVTGTRLWLLFFSLPGNGLDFLRSCRRCHSAAVVQWFVDFSAHPQVMQQHGQLSGRRDNGPLLAASPVGERRSLQT